MNLQNIPKYLAGWNIKKLFIPSSDEMLICNCDYKGAEVRVFTIYAPDKGLIDAINDGLDMHSYFAAKVYGRPYADYANRDNPIALPDKNYRKALDKERTQIKRVVFGILYGAGKYKIAETVNVTVEIAQQLIRTLYDMFKAIEQYGYDIEKEVREFGFVETVFGRRRRFPLHGLSKHQSRAFRQAKNFKIQSTSSDIVMGQLVEVDEHLQHDLRGRMLMTVHDSMVFEFPKKYVHQLKDFLTFYGETSIAKKYSWLPVPFKMDIEVGPSYGEVQSIDSYIKEHPFTPTPEGVIEEQELLNELREDAFQAA
jgi:DNA polymerase-1